MARPERTRLAALCAATVVVLLSATATAASATTQSTLIVGQNASAHRAYGPLTCCTENATLGLGENAPSYARPETCASSTQTACAVIPVDLRSLADGEALLKATVTWATAGVGGNALRIGLWRGSTAERIVEGSVASSANAPGPANLDGSKNAHLSVYDTAPQPGRYMLVVENAFGTTGVDLDGFQVDVTVELPGAWPLDNATAGSANAGAGARGATGFKAGTTSRGTPSGQSSSSSPSEPALPLASRLNGIRPVSDHSLLASISSSLPWLAVVVAVLLLCGVAFRLRRQVKPSGGVAVRARLSSWFSNLRLFWKLLVPFVAVLLVIGIAGAYLTVHYLASRADTTVNQNLLQRSTSAQTYLRDQELYLLEAERFAANLEGVPEATASSNQAELRKDLASAVAVRKDLDVLAATDGSGQGLVNYLRDGQSFSAQGGVTWSEAPAVKEVLAGVADATGDKRTSFVRLGDGSVLLVTAGPIRTDKTVGAAVAALSADGLAKGAATRARGTVGLYDLSGAAMGVSKKGSLPARLNAAEAKGNLRVRRGSVATLYEPFVVRGTKVGTVAVSIPTGSAYASVRGAALRLGLLVALAMAAVVGFGVLVSRYILRTVEPLVETNRALGQGDLSVRAPVRSGDELGELAEGFNLMAEQLQASYGELERRVAERTEELSRLYADNVAASESRNQFFATISHEFRTPLFAILANAELLADPTLGPDSPEETAEFAQTIQASAQSLLGRVNELLDLARSESTGVELDTGPVSLAEAWAEIAPSVGALARTGGLAVTDDVSAELPAVVADPERLRQILLNLTSNAVKYTPAGGRISISARELDDVVQVAVADTGQGIPKRVGERVFEPYYRVKGSKAQGGQASSGLGLALTKRLVEAHGGRIWFESKPNRGSTFYFTLPVAKQRAKARTK